MGSDEAWTVGKLLTWTTDFLKKHGSPSPRLDAEILLAHARNCQRIELYTAFGEEPSEETKTAFRQMVRDRSTGTPVAYLVGHKEFYSASFEVNSYVLIPRSETEHLIVEALDRAKEIAQKRGPGTVLRIADVGTGSGIIAVTVASHLKNCQIVATDTSPAALQTAQRNAQRHGVSEQIEFVETDILPACDSDRVFDLVLSNPPYVSTTEYEQLEKTVREFEPRQALEAGSTGWEVIARLLAQAESQIAADGYLIFEFSPMLAEKLDTFLPDKWQLVAITKDLAGHARIVTLQRQTT